MMMLLSLRSTTPILLAHLIQAAKIKTTYSALVAFLLSQDIMTRSHLTQITTLSLNHSFHSLVDFK
jgi:hypothetical protein